MQQYRAVDVMGFAGGFTLGMVQAGFQLVGKRELPGGFGVANCEVNRELLGYDWQTEIGKRQTWSVPSAGVDVVFGNPPCSAWSVMTSKSSRGTNAKVSSCMWDFVEYTALALPQVAVFESVQQAYSNPEGRAMMRGLRAHLEKLTSQSWTLHHVLHNAYSVGGAAQRRRYFWVASRIPFGVEPMELDHLPVLNDVIGDLAPLANTWELQPYRNSMPSRWVERERVLSPSGAVDGHVFIDNPLTRRIRDLIAAVPWNPGEPISVVAQRHWDTYARLPPSFAATEESIVKKDFHMGFTTPVRWRGDSHARVITGGGLVMTLHPWLPRTITHREAARIMGFPDDWRLLPLRNISNIGATHGKGITVQCGRWIGTWVQRALAGSPGAMVGTPLEDREFVVDLTSDWRRVGTSTQNHSIIDLLAPNLTTYVPDREEVLVTQAAAAASPEASGEATQATRGRGRPRPQETIERDQKVYDALETPKTKDEIGTSVEGVTPSQVYLSLYRLRKANRIERTRNDSGKHVWARKVATS